MDLISFKLTDALIEDYITTTILINGCDLRNILVSYEIEQVTEYKDYNLVGAYEGISAFIAFHMHKHFLKETVSDYQQADNRFTLFEYVHSGIPGEHTVACRITIYEDRVEWTDFINCSVFLKQCFQYPELKFCFDRTQYEKAIHDITVNEVNKLYG
ncbi:MAG: hypothetical protein AAF717_05680 [Bacteroidota bacterium]